MPFTLKCPISSTMEIKIDSASLVGIRDSTTVALLDALDLLLAQGIVEFDFKDTATPQLFSYSFTHSDGREWKQKIHLNGPGNPTMTFDVADEWLVSEFIPNRAVRDQVVALTEAAGVTRVHVTPI